MLHCREDSAEVSVGGAERSGSRSTISGMSVARGRARIAPSSARRQRHVDADADAPLRASRDIKGA